MSDEKKDNLAIISDVSEYDITKLKAALEVRFKMDFYEWEHFTLAMEEVPRGKYGYDHSLICKVTNEKKETITEFWLEAFPRNNDILVSTHVYIPQGQRNKMYGTRFHEMRIAAASLAGFRKILATVEAANEAEVRILVKHDWKIISSYHNYGAYDKHQVDLWERSL